MDHDTAVALRPPTVAVSLRAVALVVVTAILADTGAVPAQRAGADSAIPTQFVAKSYTEVLGRAPEQEEWRRAVDRFERSGCSPSTLRALQSRLLLGDEYARLGYGPPARLLTAYRAILNREPDTEGFQHWRDAMSLGMPWRAVVDALYASPEFIRLARDVICNPDAPHAPNYFFGTQSPIDIGTDGPGVATEGELRAALRPNGAPAPPGTTVLLARGATITISQTLDVPPGVSVATAGSPPRTAYALMARLVRDRPTDQYGSVVTLEPGAALSHVWVDGQGDDPYAVPRTAAGGAVDVILVPGAVGTTVEDSRVDNASAGGFSTIVANPSSTAPACGSVQRTLIRRNLVTDYSSAHADQRWRDGISVGCENADVTDDTVIDASDAAIVVYRPAVGAQTAVVRGNVVIGAGNSAFSALSTDPLSAAGLGSTDCDAQDFTGTVVRDNLVWTGDRTLFDFGLAIGTRGFAFLGPSWCTGVGASFVDNSTGILTARVVEGIAVAGMRDVTTADNFDEGGIIPARPEGVDRRCPVEPSVAEVRAGHASGRLQQYVDRSIDGCLGGPRRAPCARSDDPSAPADPESSSPFACVEHRRD